MKTLHFARKRLLYLSMLSFVFVATTALGVTPKEDIKLLPQLFTKRDYKVSRLPVLSNPDSFPVVSAQGVIVVDIDSAVTLYEKNADAPLLPASTTKIVTALVSMDFYERDDILEVGKFKVDGQKMGLVAGEKITADTLLYGLLVYSANDAAEVLAQNYLGGRDAFILAMNGKAKELHLGNTVFKNPTGLDGGGHVSTARDMVRVSEVAMRNPYFAQIVGTKEKRVADISGKMLYNLKNINELLGKVDGVRGVKTGWTENARENLVTYVVRGDKKIMIALLGSQDRFGETKELIDWVYSNYEWMDVLSKRPD